jgi:hypothetical protein
MNRDLASRGLMLRLFGCRSIFLYDETRERCCTAWLWHAGDHHDDRGHTWRNW